MLTPHQLAPSSPAHPRRLRRSGSQGCAGSAAGQFEGGAVPPVLPIGLGRKDHQYRLRGPPPRLQLNPELGPMEPAQHGATGGGDHRRHDNQQVVGHLIHHVHVGRGVDCTVQVIRAAIPVVQGDRPGGEGDRGRGSNHGCRIVGIGQPVGQAGTSTPHHRHRRRPRMKRWGRDPVLRGRPPAGGQRSQDPAAGGPDCGRGPIGRVGPEPVTVGQGGQGLELGPRRRPRLRSDRRGHEGPGRGADNRPGRRRVPPGPSLDFIQGLMDERGAGRTTRSDHQRNPKFCR